MLNEWRMLRLQFANAIGRDSSRTHSFWWDNVHYNSFVRCQHLDDDIVIEHRMQSSRVVTSLRGNAPKIYGRSPSQRISVHFLHFRHHDRTRFVVALSHCYTIAYLKINNSFIKNNEMISSTLFITPTSSGTVCVPLGSYTHTPRHDNKK